MWQEGSAPRTLGRLGRALGLALPRLGLPPRLLVHLLLHLPTHNIYEFLILIPVACSNSSGNTAQDNVHKETCRSRMPTWSTMCQTTRATSAEMPVGTLRRSPRPLGAAPGPERAFDLRAAAR